MNITPVQNTSFTARYKMLVTQDEYKQFKEKIEPVLAQNYGEHYSYFYGKSPVMKYYRDDVDEYIKLSPNKEKAVKQLKKMGIRTNVPQYETLWLATGRKDAIELKLMKTLTESHLLSDAGFTRIRTLIKYSDASLQEVLMRSTQMAVERENMYYTSYVKHRPYSTVSNFGELLTKILSIREN